MVKLPPKITGPWNLATDYPPLTGPKVFSIFHCGGGSTMGYKLAGCDVLGGVEIDPRMSAVYVANHKPKYEYVEGVKDFNARPNDTLPPELFQLDILDGSPPCSSFSMAGAREKKWGKESKFREGQAVQVLDDLFGEFLRTVEKLQPKVVIAENVKGMLVGNAKGYVREVLSTFDALGYKAQLFLVDASTCGVPQKRERVFFLARKKEITSDIALNFNEQPRTVAQAFEGCNDTGHELSGQLLHYWNLVKPGQYFRDAHIKKHLFNFFRLNHQTVSPTLTARGGLTHYTEPRFLSRLESIRLSSFPDDYNFGKEKPEYVCGMSVPPFMTQRIALAVRKQWLG